MRFGAAITNCREGKVYPAGFTTAEFLVDLATIAEASGFDSLWANDLNTTYDEALADPEHTPPNFFEALTTIAYLAAATDRITFLTSAVTAALREPVLLAKQVATIDALSGGRMRLGLGLGGKRTELERLRGRTAGAVNRGQWLDESVALIRRIFAERVVDHEGTYFSVSGAEIYPKPVQKELPLYFTGGGNEMLRRTAEVGSGWIHMNVTPEQLAERVSVLQAAKAAAGRAEAPVEICIQFDIVVDEDQSRAEKYWAASLAGKIGAARGRASTASYIAGDPAHVVERLLPYRDAGLDHVGLIVSGTSHEHVLDQVRLLGAEVVPTLR